MECALFGNRRRASAAAVAAFRRRRDQHLLRLRLRAVASPRGTMAAFLEGQLDFIFFFYGLAFVLLGAVSFSIARESQNPSWAMLGLFGLVHGVGEWLDLAALVMGDGPAFATVRTAIMAGSFVFLIEFARQISIQLDGECRDDGSMRPSSC